MDTSYIDVILWVIGSMIAIKILLTLMKRRRDQLVDQLKDYVERSAPKETQPVGDKTE